MITIYNKNNPNQIYAMYKNNNMDINEYISKLSQRKNIPLSDIKYTYSDDSMFDDITSEQGKNKFLIIENNEAKVHTRINDHSIDYFYDKREFQREYSQKDIMKLYYDDYINFNLKNIYQNNNDIEMKFIGLDKLYLRPHMMNKRWDVYKSNKFLMDVKDDRLALGRDISKKGTWFPIIVLEQNGKYYVLEGSHRIISLKLLSGKGEIPKNKPMFCIIFKEYHFELMLFKRFVPMSNSLILRNNIDILYADSVLKNKELVEKLKCEIRDNGGNFINDYIYERETFDMSDVVLSIYASPLWLCDLLYYHKDDIPPSGTINDIGEFEKWKET